MNVAADNCAMDSNQLNVDLQTLQDRTGPENSENDRSNDQTFQTSAQTDREMLV